MNYLYNFFDDSKIHDYKLCEIIINYFNNNIIIKFKDEKNYDKTICIDNFTEFSISHNEPWESGQYIVSSECYINEYIGNIEFQLNSGDICKIEYKLLR